MYSFLSRLIFRASVAALLTPEAGDDDTLYDAFRAFDQHLPLAAAGYKVTPKCVYVYMCMCVIVYIKPNPSMSNLPIKTTLCT
jgi:hypothetical protein